MDLYIEWIFSVWFWIEYWIEWFLRVLWAFYEKHRFLAFFCIHTEKIQVAANQTILPIDAFPPHSSLRNWCSKTHVKISDNFKISNFKTLSFNKSYFVKKKIENIDLFFMWRLLFSMYFFRFNNWSYCSLWSLCNSCLADVKPYDECLFTYLLALYHMKDFDFGTSDFINILPPWFWGSNKYVLEA